MRKVMRIGAIAALAVAGMLGATGSASADADATIELHLRYCPPGAVDVFADCHDNPAAGIEVWVEDYQDDATLTDADGNAVFVVGGGYVAYWYYDGYYQDIDGVPTWPDDYVTSYCSVEGGDGSDIEDKQGEFADWTYAIPVAADDYITCDIYFWNWDMDPIHGGAETPNTGAGPMTTGASAGFFLAGVVALGGLAVASRKRAFR